jgi:uncharacterized protein
MTSDSRIATVQDFFQKSFRGDISSAIELLEEDASYHVPGSNQMSGHFEGCEQVARHLTELLQLTKRTVNVLEWEDWLAGLSHVAALTHIRIQRRGALHTFRGIYLVEMSEAGKIKRIEMFFSDATAVDRFFSAAVD